MAKKKVSRARIVRVLPQHGRSVTKVDAKRKAKLPGLRVSKAGNRYTETRKNRSDKRGKKI